MDGLIQGLIWNVVVAGVLGIVVWCVSRLRWVARRPGVVYGLWLLVLAKLVCPPFVGLPVLSPLSANRVEVVSEVPATWEEVSLEGESLTILPGGTELQADQAVVVEEAAVRSWWEPWMGWGVAGGVSLLGTVVLWLWGWRQTVRWGRLLRECGAGDARLQELARRAAGQMGVTREVKVRVVPAVLTPFLWVKRGGVEVVLSAEVVERLREEELVCVLSHELAHYRRGDHWGHWFAGCVVSVFWWNPMGWWSWRELRAAQEVCCDALVLARHGEGRRLYAETLFKVLELVQTGKRLQPSLACGFGDGGHLRRRFEMLADLKLKSGISWWVKLCVVPGVGLLFCLPIRGEGPKTKPPETTEKPAAREPEREKLIEGIDAREIERGGYRVEVRFCVRGSGDPSYLRGGRLNAPFYSPDIVKVTAGSVFPKRGLNLGGSFGGLSQTVSVDLVKAEPDALVLEIGAVGRELAKEQDGSLYAVRNTKTVKFTDASRGDAGWQIEKVVLKQDENGAPSHWLELVCEQVPTDSSHRVPWLPEASQIPQKGMNMLHWKILRRHADLEKVEVLAAPRLVLRDRGVGTCLFESLPMKPRVMFTSMNQGNNRTDVVGSLVYERADQTKMLRSFYLTTENRLPETVVLESDKNGRPLLWLDVTCEEVQDMENLPQVDVKNGGAPLPVIRPVQEKFKGGVWNLGPGKWDERVYPVPEFAGLSKVSLSIRMEQLLESVVRDDRFRREGNTDINRTTPSLVVRQTEEGHQQIGDLLKRLREQSDVSDRNCLTLQPEARDKTAYQYRLRLRPTWKSEKQGVRRVDTTVQLLEQQSLVIGHPFGRLISIKPTAFHAPQVDVEVTCLVGKEMTVKMLSLKVGKSGMIQFEGQDERGESCEVSLECNEVYKDGVMLTEKSPRRVPSTGAKGVPSVATSYALDRSTGSSRSDVIQEGRTQEFTVRMALCHQEAGKEVVRETVAPLTMYEGAEGIFKFDSHPEKQNAAIENLNLFNSYYSLVPRMKNGKLECDIELTSLTSGNKPQWATVGHWKPTIDLGKPSRVDLYRTSGSIWLELSCERFEPPPVRIETAEIPREQVKTQQVQNYFVRVSTRSASQDRFSIVSKFRMVLYENQWGAAVLPLDKDREMIVHLVPKRPENGIRSYGFGTEYRTGDARQKPVNREGLELPLVMSTRSYGFTERPQKAEGLEVRVQVESYDRDEETTQLRKAMQEHMQKNAAVRSHVGISLQPLPEEASRRVYSTRLLILQKASENGSLHPRLAKDMEIYEEQSAVMGDASQGMLEIKPLKLQGKEVEYEITTRLGGEVVTKIETAVMGEEKTIEIGIPGKSGPTWVVTFQCNKVAKEGSVLAFAQTVRTYSVSDLVVKPGEDSKKNLHGLMAELKQEDPQSWFENGGLGNLAVNEKTNSLVVRQTDEGHARIAKRLEEKRVKKADVIPKISGVGEKKRQEGAVRVGVQPTPWNLFLGVAGTAFLASGLADVGEGVVEAGLEAAEMETMATGKGSVRMLSISVPGRGEKKGVVAPLKK